MFKNETQKSTTSQQTIIPPSAGQTPSRNSINAVRKGSSATIPEKEFSFPTFARSDLAKFTAKVVGSRTKVLQPTEYIVEIRISSPDKTIIKYRRYNQFRAFYKALKLRFVNVKWPDFPPRIQLIRKIETRQNAFNEIFKTIFETMQAGSSYKKSLLSIFYAFFLEADENIEEFTNIKEEKKSPQLLTQKTAPQLAQFTQLEAKDDSDGGDSYSDDLLKKSVMLIENKYEAQEVSAENLYDEDTRNETLLTRKQNDTTTLDSGSPPGMNKKKGYSPTLEVNLTKNSPVECKSWDSTDQEIVPFEIKENVFEENKMSVVRERYKRHGNTVRIEGGLYRNTKEARSSLDQLQRKTSNESEGDSKSGLTADNEEEPKVTTPRGVIEKPMKIKKTGDFSGIIYMKLSSNLKWNKYFAQITKSTICLYNNIMVNRPNHFIFCYKSTIRKIEDSTGSYIELYHSNDSEKFFLTTEIYKINSRRSVTEEHSLHEWYEQLVHASKDATGLESLEDEYSPVGKIQMVISEAKHMRKLPKNGLFYIRLQHTPYTLKTSTALVDEGERIDWKQSFFMPIYDTFFPIKVELVCQHNSGWIIENKSEEVICSGEILVADILSMDSEHILKHNLELNYVDPERKKQQDAYNQKRSHPVYPELKIKIKNLSNMKSLLHAPNKDYLEGSKIETENVSIQILRLGIARLKRIILYVGSVIRLIKDIFHWKYPSFSYICILIMTHMILTLEPSDLIGLLFLFLTLLSLYKHPRVESLVNTVLNAYLFSDKYLNRNYHPPAVQTFEERSFKKDMETEKWKYKFIDEDSVLKKIKIAKKSTIVFASILLKITGFFEKLKNIVIWHDPPRTIIFVIFTFIAYCVLAVLPFRFVFLVAVWANFIKGINFYERRYTFNVGVATRAINFLTNKMAPLSYNQVSVNPSAPWPTVNFDAFQKRMVKELTERFRLNLGENLLKDFGSPQDLIGALASCSKFLTFKHEPGEDQTMVNAPQEVPPEDFGLKMIHFIMNAPSDYYRVLHPKQIDLYTNWRKQTTKYLGRFETDKEENKRRIKRKMFEIGLVVLFFTLYEIRLLYNFLTS